MDKILSVDWGTTNCRIRLVDTSTANIIGERSTAGGIASVYTSWRSTTENRQTFYLSVLDGMIKQLADDLHLQPEGIPVIISGMASSTLGITELPYAKLPFAADGASADCVKLVHDQFKHDTWLISGVSSENDVMRGEETQWIGLMQDEQFSGDEDFLFIFPGTHSKHLFVKDRAIIDFKTYMTGEFFSLLTTHSVLKNSVDVVGSLDEASEEDAFIEGVEAAKKSNLLHESFMVRTNDVFGRLNPRENASYLSGLLMGTELLHIGHVSTVLTAGSSLSRLYSLALKHLAPASQLIICAPAVHDKSVVNGQLTIFNKIMQAR